MTSLRNKVWMHVMAVLVLLVIVAAPAAAAPADQGGELSFDSVWQVLVDGWGSVLAAVGIDEGGSEPDDSTVATTPDGTTQTDTTTDGDFAGSMDPDG